MLMLLGGHSINAMLMLLGGHSTEAAALRSSDQVY